jgi:tRNA-2-methylthio-N6-dimethylallyladenosine synthase
MFTTDTNIIADMPKKKKVLIETWGCQMNVADSESMLAMLNRSDYEMTKSAEDADLVLLNTCHIREKAKHKVLSRLGELKELKTTNRKMTVAVAGCVAQAEGAKLLKAAPVIDIMLGPGKISELGNLLKAHDPQIGPSIALGFDRHHHELPADLGNEKPTITGKEEISRYVNIAQGCDNFCTFCVVPFTRGREVSRSPESIIAECRQLIEGGAREIMLLGQNVNSYGLDLVRDGALADSSDGPFVDLLTAVAQLPNLLRLRFTTSNPHDFSPQLAKLFANTKALGRYMHLPVQSGNDEILERMRRKVTVETYMERIAWLRAIDPEFSISTDLIVGFPGETEEQFEDTIKLVQQVRYSFIYAFTYSSRKNTAAARFRDQVDEVEKKRRLARLNSVQDEIIREIHASEIGRTREVLFLYQSKKDPGSYYGRTEQYRLLKVRSSEDLIGQCREVEVVEANKTALVGQLV